MQRTSRSPRSVRARPRLPVDPRDEIAKHLPRLRLYARKLKRYRPHEVDDLVQDTVLRALEKWHLYTPGTRLAHWLVSIMHNTHVNGVRQGVRLPDHSSLDQMLYHPADPAPDATVTILANEVRAAIAGLPAPMREVMTAAYLDEVRWRDLAETLGVPFGTIQSRLGRSRIALMRVLEGKPAQKRSKVVKTVFTPT